MSAPGTVAWLARHEFRLAWRDWRSMITAGRRRHVRTVVAILALFAVFMHGIAFVMLPRQFVSGSNDKATLLIVTGWGLPERGCLFFFRSMDVKRCSVH